MTNVKHNLPDAVLMAYSAGALPEAFDLVVATHVSLSDESRARLGAFDAVGGALLEQGETAELREGSLEATLARIAGAPMAREPENRRSPDDRVFPKPLRDYVGGGLGDVRWRSIGMGCRQAILKTSGSATVRLLYIPSGVSLPDHSHAGTEMTLVLQGAYRDEVDSFARGDVEVVDQDVSHTPVAIGSDPCICLSATDARLRFNAILPRLAQPFLRI